LPAILFGVAAILPSTAHADDLTLFDAQARGVFNIGPGQGDIRQTFDESRQEHVLTFDYTIPKGSIIGVWTQGYPPALADEAANAVRIGVHVPSAEQLQQVSVKMEIKGQRAVQVVPLSLSTGWNEATEAIQWERIGPLKEVVFVVSPVLSALEDGGSVAGTLSFTVDFSVQPIAPTVVEVPQPVRTAVAAPPPDAPPPTYDLLDAQGRGVFNIGPGEGDVRQVFDEARQQNVLRFDYDVPKRSLIGVWTQGYPPQLTEEAANAVRIGVQVPEASQLNDIALKVEIKGQRGMQTIPLQLSAGWNSVLESIHWGRVGKLKEVVFIISPILGAIGEEETSVKGWLAFTTEFETLTSVQKHLIVVKVGMVVGFSLLVGWLVSLLGGLGLGKGREEPGARAVPEGAAPSVGGLLSHVRTDLLYGAVAVLIASVAMSIYSMGMVSPLDAGLGLDVLGVALAGALIAEAMTFGHTGRHLRAAEFTQHMLLSGLLAAASSRQDLLQAPSAWGELLTLSKVSAALAFVIYHVTNACTIVTSRRSVRAITGALIVGTPFLTGWLLLLVSPTAVLPVMEPLGRFLVVLVFNEIVTNGISWALRGRLVTTAKAHGMTVFVSAMVMFAPLVADLGSTPAVAALPFLLQSAVAVVTAMGSYAGLWGEVYLITGLILDSLQRTAPTSETVTDHVRRGMGKGMAYAAMFMAILYALHLLLTAPGSQAVMAAVPILIGIAIGALFFPFVKAIIETFDGSQPFFDRLRYSYGQMTLYARGAVAGWGFAYGITHGFFEQTMADRMTFGLLVGLVASAGVSLARDAVYAARHQGRVQSWKLYLTDACLGAFIGAAAGFYLDARQVPVVVEKFKLYTSSGFAAKEYITYPLVSKWGRIDLGTYTGGVKLLFTESLAGVINWAVAAWLFAINRVFMEAFFQKDRSPIKFFFSRAGFVELIKHMLFVLRWGLWMSPIIFSFLRMMPDPTWYNQDGAIRTVFAAGHALTHSPEVFRQWSLDVFVYVLAWDFFRVLIWMDHMGLRVATLVNLSFIGLDKLDERVAKFIGPATAQRYLPEAIKRFATWCPLLIPFYLPRGEEWDYAWSTSQAMQSGGGGGWLGALHALGWPQLLVVMGAAVLACAAISHGVRTLNARAKRRKIPVHRLSNRAYTVVLRGNGEIYSEAVQRQHVVTRPAYDPMHPAGRALFLMDRNARPASEARAWPIVGNFPSERMTPSRIERSDDRLRVTNAAHGVRSTVEIRLMDQDTTAELWTVVLENSTEATRELSVVPYLEWVLGKGIDDRFHTQYARLFSEMEYVREANAILAWQRSTKAMGVLAASVAPEGVLTSRVDFIGRARSLWNPRVAETLTFAAPRNTEARPTFDPIGSLRLDVTLQPRTATTVRLLIGYARSREAAVEMIHRTLQPEPAPVVSGRRDPDRSPVIGHGEIPMGTPQPYAEFRDRGNTLVVQTPYTPRPFDHALSNALGHSVMVTNRGLHTSCHGNSQQNRLTPDWPDTVTREVPSEAIYLYDPERAEWWSPTYHPLNDRTAHYEAAFSVDGTATYRMTRPQLSTELTVFVPPNDPTGVYLLTITNHEDRPRRLRVAPYFQMVLSFQPEQAGPLGVRFDPSLQALYVENPRNTFWRGTAFAAMSIPAERYETKRGRFFGRGRSAAHPFLVEQGVADATELTDELAIASFVGTLEIPAHGTRTVAIMLGQADDRAQAAAVIRKYQDVDAAQASLEETRRWWMDLMGTVTMETNQPQFDQLQNWLKYQALAERIWARRGFYQTSGAYGFRDQLQDSVNLLWVDPALARRQIVLHASQQFLQGDVFHWFFTLRDGRTAFACRSHASDNPLWLAWAVVEYLRATDDGSILDEMTSYVASENPFRPLPKNKIGWGGLYHRSTKADSVYRHCLRSIDLVLEKRMGAHGLPLIGTGDWNDGLDEIGSEGKGESVWLGFFLYYILRDMVEVIAQRDGPERKAQYVEKMQGLKAALELTWRGDRYLRAIHDDGTEIGVKDTGVWEIDALTASWAVMCGINPKRALKVFDTAIRVLEREKVVLLGWPALHEHTTPYLGRSSKYPEGVRENGMYCHGVQWLIKAARLLAEQFETQGDAAKASEYRQIAWRLWRKITPVAHVNGSDIEVYGGQPNKQPADILTAVDPGRMIWNGYTGAAGWLFRESIEGIVGASLVKNALILPDDLRQPRGDLQVTRVHRDIDKSPLKSTKGRMAGPPPRVAPPSAAPVS